jgi:hypothetical protein
MLKYWNARQPEGRRNFKLGRASLACCEKKQLITRMSVWGDVKTSHPRMCGCLVTVVLTLRA